MTRTSNYMTISSKDRIKAVASILLAFVLFLGSCKKDGETIGSDFVGSGFNVITVDTFDLITYSSKQDTSPTRELTYYMLGDMNDPLFGTSKANIITQYNLPVLQFNFDNHPIDSIVLQMQYTGTTAIYGNQSTPQTLKVYEITEDLSESIDTPYYSNRNYSYNTAEIGEWNGTFNLNDSVKVKLGSNTITYAPHLRIKLDKNNFINKMAAAPGQGLFNTQEAFKAAFKGLYIVGSTSGLAPGQGSLAYFNFNAATSSASMLVVYYADSLKAEFPIKTTTNAKANQFKTSTGVPLQARNGGTHRNACFVQPLDGIKTRILMPSLLNILQQGRIAVVGAQLVLNVKDTTTSTGFGEPSRLALLGCDSTGSNAFLSDLVESAEYYGGIFDATNKQYRFNLIRHLQDIITTYHNTGVNKNYGLNLIVPSDAPVAANRLVLDTDKAQGKIKLILSYTVIK